MKRLAALVAPLLVLALAAPAVADSFSRADPAGDATWFRFDPEPKPCGTSTTGSSTRNDIRRLVVRHTRHRVVLALRVAGMTGPPSTSVEFRVTTPRRSWDVTLDRWGGTTDVSFSRPSRPPRPEPGEECGYYVESTSPTTCPGATGTLDRAAGLARVSFPRRCVRTPRWVRVGATIRGWVDDASHSDSWAPAGREEGDTYNPALTGAVRPDPPAR